MNKEGVVRYLSCRIPDSPDAIEILKDEMINFGEESWYNDDLSSNVTDENLLMANSGSSNYELVCRYVPGDGYGNISSSINVGDGDQYIFYYFHEECTYEYVNDVQVDMPESPEELDPFGGGGGIGNPNDPNDDPNPCIGLGDDTQYPITTDGEIIGCGDEEAIIVEQVKNLLEEDEFALLEVPCSEIPKWQGLAQHVPPQSIIDKIENLDDNYTSIINGDWDIQYIQDADGAVVNMDYFPITVNQLPDNPNTGQPFTADGFLEYIRTNLDDFFDGNSTEFGPYNSTENQIWQSGNYLGAIMRFDIPIIVKRIFIGQQDGSVISSAQSGQNWNFTTIESPADWNHPVSGTRKFGYKQNGDGSYTFFTRGVDRIAESFDEFVGNLPVTQSAFEGADALWNTFKENVYEYVEGQSGSAQQPVETDNKEWRTDWDKISDIMMGTGNKMVSDLGCN